MDWIDLVVRDVAELPHDSPEDQPGMMLVKAEELRAIIAERSPLTADEQLHTFLNAAAVEGFVLDGVDAAALYVSLFRDRYDAMNARLGA